MRARKEVDWKEAVARALKGDQEGFRILYDATYRDKYYIARKYMKNEQDAADVLQEAYLRAWKHLHTLQDPEHFAGWLSVIVANCAISALKRVKPMLFSEMDTADEDGGDPPYDEEDLRTEYRPELALEQKEEARILQEMLDALSDEQRICILMFYVEEKTAKEIAEALGCSRNTVLARLSYGRKNLKKIADKLQSNGRPESLT